ncbi:MAG: response regulator, partial [Acidobacteriota bacterium]
RATDVIDTTHFLERAFPDWFRGAVHAGPSCARILLVDDSPFFRNLLGPILQSAGYEVSTAPDGAQALGRLERGERFDLVLSDIEMPVMDGFDLATRIKAHPHWCDIPLLALTSRGSPEDRQRGLEIGYAEYLVKFDRNAVLAAVAEHVNGNNGGMDA